jgi:acyl-CoA thioester hydrolase
MSQPTLLESTYRVRFTDCDPLGHLNNSRYLDYFLNAREDHVRDAYGMQFDDFIKNGAYWVVTEHQILYRRPALYNEVVTIGSMAIGQDEQHLWIEMQMWNEGGTELKSLLWTRLTSVELKTGRKAPHTREFMAFARGLIHGENLLQQGISHRMMELLAGG